MSDNKSIVQIFIFYFLIASTLSGCVSPQTSEIHQESTLVPSGVEITNAITPTIPKLSSQSTTEYENATVTWKISTPFPTIHNLSIEWFIHGDKNNDGVVTVRFRKSGKTVWQEGMPLRRIPAGSNPIEGFDWVNKHSGSIFNLEAGTTYQVELTLKDPDGGSTEQVVYVTTREIPKPMENAPVILVTPATLMNDIEKVEPGYILSLQPGEYPGFSIKIDGEDDRPIVIQGSKGVIINGSIDLDERRFIMLDGLQVNGSIHFYDGDSISVTHCQIHTDGDGINFEGHSKNAYIADNYIHGSTIWQKTSLGVNGDNHGEGIQFSGSGHVIEHNIVIGFRDNISMMEGVSEAFDQFSIDILNNDIYEAADDGIEADFCFNNCRIMDNRLTNVFMGLSSQPGLGGPTYFIRNVMFNVIYEPFKLHNGTVGDVILHNTVVKSGDAFGVYTDDYFSRTLSRNNVFFGGPGGLYNGYNSGRGLVASLQVADPTCNLDYDAFGTLATKFFGQIGNSLLFSFDDLRSKTTEKHAILIDLGDFASPINIPEKPFPAYLPLDLRPKADSKLVDAAFVIPGINDNYNGNAPDIGAYEVGEPLPVYGVRE